MQKFQRSKQKLDAMESLTQEVRSPRRSKMFDPIRMEISM